jgi:hypothetical protein
MDRAREEEEEESAPLWMRSDPTARLTAAAPNSSQRKARNRWRLPRPMQLPTHGQ